MSVRQIFLVCSFTRYDYLQLEEGPHSSVADGGSTRGVLNFKI